jgi:hypothetical protein
VKPRLLAVWAAAWSLGSAIAERFRRAEPSGLVTVEDADEFVAEMHAVGRNEVGPDVVETTPIFDVLEQEFHALYAHRLRVLGAPTQEIREAFDLLVVDWRCSHCDLQIHADCPGCSCPCAVAVATS